MAKKTYTIGQEVKKERIKRKYPCTMFAKMINKSLSSLSQIERGHRNPPKETLYRIMEIFDLPPETRNSWLARVDILPPDIKKVMLNEPVKFFEAIQKLQESN